MWSVREQSNLFVIYLDELSIYKWTEPWNIKGRFPESWGLRASVSSSPLPLPLPFFFFCSRSNFRAITRLETLATQAMTVVGYEPLQIYNRTAVSILGKVSFYHRARRELKLGIQNAGFLRWLDWIFWWDTSQVWALTTSPWVKIWKKGFHNCII